MTGILRNFGCQVIQIGGVDDHVHVLFRLSRTVSVAQTIKDLKTGSNKWLKEKWPHLQAFEWQGGYGILGVGVERVQTVVKYIQNQEEHHKTVSFKEELLRLLEENEIEYDERYLWD
jgi:REP element-mobilizing transposase RayT